MPLPRRPVLDLDRITLRAVDGEGPDYRWRAEWYPPGDGGRMKTRSLGARCSEAEALRRGATLLEEGLGLPDDRPPAALVTVQDLLEAWMGTVSARPDLRPTSVAAYRTQAARLVRLWGATPLAEVTTAAVAALRLTLLRALAPATAQLTLLVLSISWRWALEAGLVLHQPVWPRVRVPRTLRHTPRPADVEAVLARAKGWARLAIAVAWSTGARLGELCALDWADVDLGASPSVRLCGKTGPRIVPLAGAGLEALLSVPPELRRGPVRGARTPLAAGRSLLRWLEVLAAAEGVEHFTIHGLRRLAVDTLARAAVDIATAAAITGHSPAVMLQHYRQVTDDDRVRAVAQAQLGTAPRQP
jgi:integrase